MSRCHCPRHEAIALRNFEPPSRAGMARVLGIIGELGGQRDHGGCAPLKATPAAMPGGLEGS
jgi:hypothetical protein